jgi:flagellar biosynthesis protein FlhG
MRSRIKLWSIGGGKGGIGKSIFSLGLGICLARLKKKVIMIDADLGGANLHTLMGIRYPQVTLDHFLQKKTPRLEDTILETSIEGISLICGSDDVLGAANPTYAQKLRILKQIEALPADFVLLDLGAGTTFNLLDFFNYSPGKIVLFTSQATALQNAYGFIKSALYRKLAREFARDDEVLRLLYQVGSVTSEIGSISQLLAVFQEKDPGHYERLSGALWDFRLFLAVNMVKSPQDLRSPEIIQTVCADYLGIQPEILGEVPYDPIVETAINQMTPFPLLQRSGKAAQAVQQIALKVLKLSRLPQAPWEAENSTGEEPNLAVLN